MKHELALKPTYWASVSGGKDSLAMLRYIFANTDKYPLDGVVHFELEIDYPFIKDVVDEMERICKSVGVTFVRIKPRVSWYTLYEEYGLPTRTCRWCNGRYKLDAIKQLKEYMKAQGCSVISYIGYCADEFKRYENRKNLNEIYPLVDAGIEEHTILEWARREPLFNGFYLTNDRCGCMYCPLASKLELAYLYKYYPTHYNNLINMMSETEKRMSMKLGRPFAIMQSNPKYNAEYTDNIVRTKWLDKLNKLEEERRQHENKKSLNP